MATSVRGFYWQAVRKMCTTKTNICSVKKLLFLPPIQLLMKADFTQDLQRNLQNCSKHASQICFLGIQKAEPHR